MTVMVALLRGVNVGGKNKLAMQQLREVVEAGGHGDVRTYIQSGNVVFATTSRSGDKVARSLEVAIATATGVTCDVTVRTRSELAAVCKANPFLARGEDPGHLHVVFLSRPAGAANLREMDAFAPEEVAAAGRELFLLLPHGVGRSKLAAVLDRRPGLRGTARNWRTVTTLLEMADAAD